MRIPPLHDLHIHTDFSDGSSEIEDVVQRANELRLGAIAIADHFWPSIGGRPGGWKIIQRRRERIVELREEYPRLLILDGVEVDIQSDGTLAPVAGGLDQFDLVIASVHFRCDSRQWAATIRRLVERDRFHVLGHWDGYLGSYRREDGEIVASTLAETSIAIELNTRYGIDHPEFLELARDAGCVFALGSDSHVVDTVGDIAEARSIARTMGLPLLEELS